ncbi:MAG: hypothetical protein HFI88_11640 [Lachnospiraceae bacterium]|nr:hypothetical protein [Lachnospiraceae bacterium]
MNREEDLEMLFLAGSAAGQRKIKIEEDELTGRRKMRTSACQLFCIFMYRDAG